MNVRFSLRYRVALTFLLLGFLVSMFLGGIFYWLTIGMEEDLIEETLSTELENYINRYAINPYTLPPSSTHIRGYVINGKIPDSFPAPLLNLSPGLSHVQIGDSGYFVELREKNDTRFLCSMPISS